MNPMVDPGTMMIRNYDIMRPHSNFFDQTLSRMTDAANEMMAARENMYCLLPQEFYDMQRHGIESRSPAIVEDKGETKLKMEFDVHGFKPEEINVKVVGNNVLQVAAEHAMLSDAGFQRRMFVRHYTLPEGIDPAKLHPLLSDDGVLSIEAPAPGFKPRENLMRIEHKAD
jgi:HSP20 family molecular chaperone IbpA